MERMIKFDLKQDLINNANIKDKCKQAPKYSQNLYAALCNNIFIKNNCKCSYSIKDAAIIVSSLNDGGDYDSYNYSLSDFIPEGYITQQIKIDLNKIGWDLYAQNKNSTI